MSRPLRGVQWNSAGCNKDGLPDYGSLWASIEITNVGFEEGLLKWEIDEAKTKLSSMLFDCDSIHVDFFPRLRVAGRQLPFTVDFFLYVAFIQPDSWEFAQSLKALVESEARYKIVIRYWTKGVEGKSDPRELPIEGDFQGFHQKALEYWDDYGFRNLADVARLTRS